jgi:hypothetical protein
LSGTKKRCFNVDTWGQNYTEFTVVTYSRS